MTVSPVPAPAIACAAEPATAAAVQAAEADWVAALETRDRARLSCRLAPDFIDTTWRGELRGRAAVLAGLAARAPSHLALTQVEVRLLGGVAIVRGLNTQTAPDGHAIGTVRFTDVFVYRDRRWQALSAQETLLAPPTEAPR